MPVACASQHRPITTSNAMAKRYLAFAIINSVMLVVVREGGVVEWGVRQHRAAGFVVRALDKFLRTTNPVGETQPHTQLW
jgi:hypothetical protein